MTMQVQIRKIGGDDVSLDDCETFSSPMGEAIESANLLNFPYLLEISSPGISEKLVSDKDFQTFKGFPIQVIHQDKNNLEKRSEGLLNKRSDEHLHLNIKGKITRILRKNIIGVHLISPTG